MNDVLSLTDALSTMVPDVTRDWTRAKQQTDRQQRVHQRDLERLRRGRFTKLSVKAAAEQVMPESYALASDHGRLPANARQVMYAARPRVLALCDGRIWKNDSYFTQQLLPNYLAEHPDLDWDVVFDDRGHFEEPHTGHRIGLGTLAVRQYLQQLKAAEPEAIDVADAIERLWPLPTRGPSGRFRNVLFIEKEGFLPLFESIQLAARFDLAIMSTKGMSVTAARRLVERLSEKGVRIFVLHDFDKSGFSILHTLRSTTRRYAFSGQPNVIDLGLRLADVEDLALAAEPVEYDGRIDPRINLRQSGATEAECNVLVQRGHYGWSGARVELNAMTSPQLQAWLEDKLTAYQVVKYVPDDEMLAAAWRRVYPLRQIAERLDALELNAVHEPPTDLRAILQEWLAKEPASAWDLALWAIVRDAEPNDAEGADDVDD